MKYIYTLLILLSCAVADAKKVIVADIPEAIRADHVNRTSPRYRTGIFRWSGGQGSCVQAAISMAGWYQNDLAAENLLWDSDYGTAILGGSWAGRVRSYISERGIPATVTEGDTRQRIREALRSGRPVSLSFKPSHFCLLVGWDVETGEWAVVDVNFPRQITWYSNDSFWRTHQRGGYEWIVVLNNPPPPMPPVIRAWW